MKKVFDWFNFFYSIGAVIILTGVIGKLLEWEIQDFLMTLGLSIEIFIFAISSIKFSEIKTSEKVVDDVVEINETKNTYSNGTYINIQGTSKEALTEKENTFSDDSNELNEEKISLELKIENDQNFESNNLASKLEQIYKLSQIDDLFYFDFFIDYDPVEYKKLSQLIKLYFGKRMPNYEFLNVLQISPINIPEPDLFNLKLVESAYLSEDDVNILCKLFSKIEKFHFFDHFIFDFQNSEILFREKNKHEIQVYGGELLDYLIHIQKYKKHQFIVSPNVFHLKSMIPSRGPNLLYNLIDNLDFDNINEFVSILNLIRGTDDKFKEKIYKKIKVYTYDLTKENSFKYLKYLIELTLSFNDKKLAKTLFSNTVQFVLKDNKILQLFDIIDLSQTVISFGNDGKLFNININNVFLEEEYSNYTFVSNIVEDLIISKIGSDIEIKELFGLNNSNYKKYIYEKINHNLSTSKTHPNVNQLAFLLLYEKFELTQQKY